MPATERSAALRGRKNTETCNAMPASAGTTREIETMGKERNMHGELAEALRCAAGITKYMVNIGEFDDDDCDQTVTWHKLGERMGNLANDLELFGGKLNGLTADGDNVDDVANERHERCGDAMSERIEYLSEEMHHSEDRLEHYTNQVNATAPDVQALYHIAFELAGARRDAMHKELFQYGIEIENEDDDAGGWEGGLEEDGE